MIDRACAVTVLVVVFIWHVWELLSDPGSPKVLQSQTVLLVLSGILMPMTYYRPERRKPFNIFDLPKAVTPSLLGFDLNDEEFNIAVEYIYKMTPEEFMRFCRAMVELRYDAEQQGMASVAEYLRKHRKPQ